MTSLVLDLRNNPGGLLDQAIRVADVFLPAGQLILTQKGRNGLNDYEYTARNADPDRTPLVVLVNDFTASASEIVAGALQDHKRAIVMGTPTFGKGSVQTILPLGQGTAIKLTTARYYTPNGRSIQAKGIVPDIISEDPADSADDDLGVREADLDKHLINNEKTEVIIVKPAEEPKRTDTPGKTDKPNKEPKDKKPALEPGEIVSKNDYQVNQALSLLKGLQIMQNK